MASARMFTLEDAAGCGYKHIVPQLKSSGKSVFSVNDAIQAEIEYEKKLALKKRGENAKKFRDNFTRKLSLQDSCTKVAIKKTENDRIAKRSISPVRCLVPVKKEIVPVKKKGGAKKPKAKTNPSKIAKALQAKLKAKIAAVQKKEKEKFAKEQKSLKLKLKKQKESEKKRIAKQKEAERKAKLKSANAEKKFKAKMAAVAKRERDTEKKAQAKLKAQELQAKVQAKYWQQVQKQAAEAQAKRSRSSGKIPKGQRIPPALMDELTFLRQQVALGNSYGLGKGKKRGGMLALPYF